MTYSEWTFEGRVLFWVTEIIKEKGLPFDGADQEVIVEGRKRPDILIWKNRSLREPALLLSLKGPYVDAWEAADDALIASSRAGARYFATWNVNRFFMWDRYRRGKLLDQLVDAREVTTIRKWKEIDRVQEPIKFFLREFLTQFAEVYYEAKPLPPLHPDERFIYRLRSAIETFSVPTYFKIKNEFNSDRDFRSRLRRWFAEQGWTFTRADDDFEKISRQFIYLLINKLVFYHILRLKNSQLPRIEVPGEVRGEQFREILQSFFNLVVDKYATIFAANFLDTMPLADDLTEKLRRFIDKVGEYDFSRIGYEVIGRVFERLIPERERHKLGQYFTRSEIVDLIVGFCVREPQATVLDPACGAGTFLVRAYERKKELNALRSHQDILEELYGLDIAKFPAHLTSINMAARDLSATENYPRVLCEDFFEASMKKRIAILKKEYAEKYKTKGLDLTKLLIKIPLCDAVVMNPPYTRQEEMESLIFPDKYRTTLQKLVSKEWNGFHVGRRSSIYSYFFFHGGTFLKEGGRLGLITSNSWLDVDYGQYLQRYFLENFKILAIIESKVERWFEDADINTVITILEKCGGKRRRRERSNNITRFVQLKKPLKDYFPVLPTTENYLERREYEKERWDAVERLIRAVLDVDRYHEDDDLKIFPKKQLDLWEEGYDEDREKYVGSQWGKYIRAPFIFFKILEKGEGKIVPIMQLGKVRYPIKTGVNRFFYVTRNVIEKFGLEDEFLSPIVKTPKEFQTILLDTENLRRFLFSCCLSKAELAKSKKKGALNYIRWGEKQVTSERQKTPAGVPWPEVPSVQGRKYWHCIPEIKPADVICNRFFDQRFFFGYSLKPVMEDQTFYGLTYHSSHSDFKVAQTAILNSTIMALFVELHGQASLGQGVLQYAKDQMARLITISVANILPDTRFKLARALKDLSGRTIGSIFDEVGAEDPQNVTLDKVKPDRKALDRIVLEEILDLKDEDLLDVYKAIIDLVKARIARAESVVKRSRKLRGISIQALVQDMFDEIGRNRLANFPDDYLKDSEWNLITVPDGEAIIGQDLYGFYVKIDGNEVRCESAYKARYIQYALMNGKTTIRVPKNEEKIRDAVNAYGALVRDIKDEVRKNLSLTIPDRTLRKRLEKEVMQRLVRSKHN